MDRSEIVEAQTAADRSAAKEGTQDRECVAWARGLFERTAPFSTGGVYVNFMPEEEGSRVPGGAYGPNFERLARLKSKYDPKNVFRQNMNIAPAS